MSNGTTNHQLRERRRALELTQAQAAALLGVSRAIWQLWEAGTVEPTRANRDLVDAFMSGGPTAVRQLRGLDDTDAPASGAEEASR